MCEQQAHENTVWESVVLCAANIERELEEASSKKVYAGEHVRSPH